MSTTSVLQVSNTVILRRGLPDLALLPSNKTRELGVPSVQRDQIGRDLGGETGKRLPAGVDATWGCHHFYSRGDVRVIEGVEEGTEWGVVRGGGACEWGG